MSTRCVQQTFILLLAGTKHKKALKLAGKLKGKRLKVKIAKGKKSSVSSLSTRPGYAPLCSGTSCNMAVRDLPRGGYQLQILKANVIFVNCMSFVFMKILIICLLITST